MTPPRRSLWEENWPLPVAAVAAGAGFAVLRLGGRELFFATHFCFELALIVALFAAHFKIARCFYRTAVPLSRLGWATNGTLAAAFWLAMVFGR